MGRMGYTDGTSRAARLSIIIPIYAADASSVDVLRTALRFLKASDFQDFETLVADDGSPAADAIETVIREARAELVRLDRRMGPAMARNAAARKATGEILLFMDADTAVHPDTLSRLVREFERDPDLDAVMGSYDRR